MNIGRYQLLYWPRSTPFFWRWRPVRGIYSWVIYVWPLELRRFALAPSPSPAQEKDKPQ